jgi:murein DD-endopeptidase MepM/ murein hydrolase activator NlpD
LAEQNDPTAPAQESPAGLPATRRGQRAAAAATHSPAARTSPVRTSSARKSPVRRVAVIGVIAALVGTVSIPAFAAANSTPEAKTIQQLAADDAQSVVVASAADAREAGNGAALSRSSYSATTSDEIRKKKAEEAAAARAREAAKVAALNASSNSSSSRSYSKIDLNMVGPGTGSIRWPLATISHIGDGFHSRGGEHQGVDLLAPGGTPIFAATSGTVKVSSESYYGYGVAITIVTNIGGKSVETLYGHMRYGSRQVSSGQHVEVGQPIGRVGSTGRSTANHLHFEVALGGTKVDPLAWLRANAS